MTNIKKAIIVSLKNDIFELRQLANSLDYEIVETFIQNRNNPDVNSYIGSGKLQEIIDYIDNLEEEIDLIIINGSLKPSQWFNLEKLLNVEVCDRVRLILYIFKDRADSKEAELQVKLAELQYEKPYVRELIHRARSGEHPGFMAGGEYQVDDYFEMIKKQIKKAKENLDRIRKDRSLIRQHRRRGGFYIISLAGYTNAGKSSLLNLLSGGKHVKVEGRLFSTLSTKTRRIKEKNIPILLTDTVGFIQDLPAMIIDAFHATMEEIELADVILLMVDASEKKETIKDKLKVSLKELADIGVNSKIIIVLNKIDLITDDQLVSIKEFLTKENIFLDKELCAVSSKKNWNINCLLDTIYSCLPHLVNFKIKLPSNRETQSFLSWIYEKANVVEINYDNFITVSIECNEKIKFQIISKLEYLKGSIV